jgi:hypothetical protein
VASFGHIERLVVSSSPENGSFSVRFFKDGGWVTVTVDDLVPVTRTARGLTQLYARGSNAMELWPSVFEKAYAKLHNGYQNLEGGSTSQALVDLTGGQADKLALSAVAFEDLMGYAGKGWLMGCAWAPTEDEAEPRENSGLLISHAYSVIDVREVAEARGNGGLVTHRLVRVRNPWGEGEWTGPWADGTPQWKKEILDQLGYAFADDGTFWMAWDDFRAHFNKLYVCRVFEGPHSACTAKAEIPSLAGATWATGPQMLLQVPPHAASANPSTIKPLTAYVSVAQKDVRGTGADGFHEAIGLTVLRTRRKREPLVSMLTAGDPEVEVVLEPVFNYSREVFHVITVEAAYDYVLVPTRLEPAGEALGTVLMVTTEDPAAKLGLAPLAPLPRLVLDGEWTAATAGGCPNTPAWSKNPYAVFAVTQACRVTVTLTLAGPAAAGATPAAVAIGFFAFGSKTGAPEAKFRSGCLAQSPIVAGSAEGVSATFLVDPYKNPCVVVVPSTFEPGQLAAFRLTIQASSPFAGGKGSGSPVWPGVEIAKTARGTSIFSEVEGVTWAGAARIDGNPPGEGPRGGAAVVAGGGLLFAGRGRTTASHRPVVPMLNLESTTTAAAAAAAADPHSSSPLYVPTARSLSTAFGRPVSSSESMERFVDRSASRAQTVRAVLTARGRESALYRSFGSTYTPRLRAPKTGVLPEEWNRPLHPDSLARPGLPSARGSSAPPPKTPAVSDSPRFTMLPPKERLVILDAERRAREAEARARQEAGRLERVREINRQVSRYPLGIPGFSDSAPSHSLFLDKAKQLTEARESALERAHAARRDKIARLRFGSRGVTASLKPQAPSDLDPVPRPPKARDRSIFDGVDEMRVFREPMAPAARLQAERSTQGRKFNILNNAGHYYEEL